MSISQVPTACLEQHPSIRTIYLRGVPINLCQIARMQNLDHSYVSRILSGDRDPGRLTIRLAMGLAAGLGMGLEAFIDAIYERQGVIQKRRARVLSESEIRIRGEHQRDLQARRRGKLPTPRMPLGVF